MRSGETGRRPTTGDMPSLPGPLARSAAPALLTLLALAPAAPASVSKGAWDRADQRAVARAGVLPALDDGEFHGERPLASTQLREIVAAAIAETGASAPSDMGQVMKAAMPKVAGRADGRRVSALVQGELRG